MNNDEGQAVELLNLLMATGRLNDALALAEEKAGYTRAAELGPWTQLLDEGQRLQILNAMGRHPEVLERVAALRQEMQALPEESDAEETVTPWNVREVLLDTGHTAALQSGYWEQALDLNAEILKYTEARNAGDLALARFRFKDYGPLLRLERYPACKARLQDCRGVFEREHDVKMLGAVYSALADLQDSTHDREGAVGFAQVALRFTYQAGEPADCAISHHNLANYLERTQADPDQVLAHRLAGADLPAEPPGFDGVADRVERVEGVRFRDLFAALPATYPDGDAAIAAVWQQVQAEKRRSEQDAAARQAALDALPPEVTAALASGDEAAIEKAFAALSPEQQSAAMGTLREAGLLPDEQVEPLSEEDLLRDWEPLLHAIAAIAQGDDGERADIEEALAETEANGWMLREPVARIWSGERDAEILTAGLEEQEAALVRSVLDRL